MQTVCRCGAVEADTIAAHGVLGDGQVVEHVLVEERSERHLDRQPGQSQCQHGGECEHERCHALSLPSSSRGGARALAKVRPHQQ